MEEAQTIPDYGLSSDQRTARLNMVNMSGDMTRFGPDTPKLIQAIRDTMDETTIELDNLTVTTLPNFGKDLGYRTVILTNLQPGADVTQTHINNLLVTGTEHWSDTTLSVGDVDYFSFLNGGEGDDVNESTLKFIGPIHRNIEIGGIRLKDSNTLTLTASAIRLDNVEGVNDLTIGPGCYSISIENTPAKRIVFEDPASIETIRFDDLPNLEFHTPLPATTIRSGNYFAPEGPGSDSDDERVLPPYAEAPPLPPVVLATVDVPYTNQKVFDFEEVDEVPMLSLLSKMGNIVFKAKDSYFTLPADKIYDAMDDGSQVRYKCTSRIEGAPFTHQVDMENPYYYIQGNGNFVVSLAALNSGLHNHKVLELVETSEILENVASAQSVQVSPGVTRYGGDVNIVSADHCQAGTQQTVFELRGVILVHEAPPPPPAPAPAVGDKRKRSEAESDISRAASIIRNMSTGGKRTVSKKRRTYKKKRSYQGPYINPTYNTLPFKR